MQTRRGWWATAVACVLAACAGAPATGPEAAIHTRRGDVVVALELARTPEEQERGLMYRTALADGHGMLFAFPRVEEHHFWMKNTPLSLDMIFIGTDGRIVGIHANATPLSTEPITVGVPSRYVLEVPAGWATRHDVAAGDPVELRRMP